MSVLNSTARVNTLGPGNTSGKTLDVSDRALVIVQWIVYAVLCQLIDIFGTVTNIINIACFVKQGFKETVNISLLGLAVSDLCCLVPLIWTNICSIPTFIAADLPFEPMEVQYLTGSWPHLCFSRVTSWITVFITLERCLCITMPLKVKTIVTYKRVTAIILGIFIVLIASVYPVYYSNGLAVKFSAYRNKTIVGLVFTEDREEVEAINFSINNVFVQLSAFISITICTCIVVIKLKRTTKWRQKSLATSQTDNLTTRDQKVTRMVVAISSFFIVCFAPVCLITLCIILVPEFSLKGKYRNLFITVSSFGLVLESSNSATNIFIYYHMSSKFRAVLREMLFFSEKNEK